eukprot:Partr_v1_DN24857_c0_g1_i2_m29782 putative pirin (iron-binding nuclear protein)
MIPLWQISTLAVILAVVLSRQWNNDYTKRMAVRTVLKAVLSREQSEGVGARVRRSIGTGALRNLDPFLMLDEFQSGKSAGFPDHPHRGFETVTYMLDGRFMHEDFAGHSGTIGPGDLQWMTAGRGIVHAEMPHKESGVAHGLQLWVNLPAREKMCEPRYQELLAAQVPTASPADGVAVKIMAGEAFGVSASVFTKTPIHYLDVRLGGGKAVEHTVPANWTCFAYILSGSLKFASDAGKVYDAHNAIVFSSSGDVVAVENASGDTEAHFVLLAGEPINEPIVQHGPFVMNTQKEIQEAMIDYQTGSNGFERAATWSSKIGRG